MASVKSSFAWSAVEQVAPRFATIFITIALARMLEPAQYGLMAMLALFMSLAQVFADFGLSASIIQRQQLNADDETSAFALNVAVGLALAALLIGVSPWVAGFYEQPVLMPMLCVMSASVVLSSFCVVQSALLSRRMQFKQIAAIGSAATIGAGIIGLACAWLGFGVWSLVAMTVATSFIKLVMYWRLSPWRPIGRANLASIRSMWSFSSYLLYNRVAGTVYQNLYTAVIGKLYSAEALGLYAKANSLRMIPAGILTGSVNRVAFPLFSRLQDDKPLLLSRIREILRVTLMFSAGGLTLMAVTADPLIPLVLTEKWAPAVPLLRILCYAGVLYPIHALYLMALQAQGYSKLNFRIENLKMAIGVSVLAAVHDQGLTIIAWSVVGLTFAAYFINVWYNVKLLGYGWRMQAHDILPTLGLCAAAGWSAWFVASRFPAFPVVALVIQTSTFVSLCLLGVFLGRKRWFADLWRRMNELSVWLLERAKRAKSR